MRFVTRPPTSVTTCSVQASERNHCACQLRGTLAPWPAESRAARLPHTASACRTRRAAAQGPVPSSWRGLRRGRVSAVRSGAPRALRTIRKLGRQLQHRAFTAREGCHRQLHAAQERAVVAQQRPQRHVAPARGGARGGQQPLLLVSRAHRDVQQQLIALAWAGAAVPSAHQRLSRNVRRGRREHVGATSPDVCVVCSAARAFVSDCCASYSSRASASAFGAARAPLKDGSR